MVSAMSIGHTELHVEERALIREYKTSKDCLSMVKEEFTDFQKEIGSGQWEVSRRKFEQLHHIGGIQRRPRSSPAGPAVLIIYIDCFNQLLIIHP